MSINTMNAVWAHSRASGRARLVLLAIADHQGEIGSWPSIKTLAKMVNASERSVQRDIKELEELGELRVEVQNAPTRQQYKSNLYWVLLPGVTNEISGVTESESGVTNTSSGVTDSASGVTAGGALTLNRTITKPLREPSTRLPDDWQPSEASLTQMKEHFPTIDFKLETHAFRDYWTAIPGSRGMKVDWDATWRNWIRNAYKRQSPQEKNHSIASFWNRESK
jgi:DNA-binding Lrp family transcriptional regulator